MPFKLHMHIELIKENKVMKAAVIISWVLILGATLAFTVKYLFAKNEK